MWDEIADAVKGIVQDVTGIDAPTFTEFMKRWEAMKAMRHLWLVSDPAARDMHFPLGTEPRDTFENPDPDAGEVDLIATAVARLWG